MLTVDKITSIDELISLKKQWNRTLERSNNNSVYLTWEWFVTWWRNFGKGEELFTLLVKNGEEIIAILPFMKIKTRFLGLPVRKIKAISNDYTPFFDIITTVNTEEALLAVFKYLKKLRWDVIEFGSVLATSETINICGKLSIREKAKFYISEKECRNPHICIKTNWDDYYASLNSTFRKNLRRAERQIGELGQLTLEEIKKSHELDTFLEKGFMTEYSSWKGKEKTAILCIENVKRFYTEFAHLAAEKDWLSLFFLNVNGKSVAFDYSLRYGEVLEGIKMGYDEAYSKYSPGQLMRKKILEKIFKENFDRFNFRGGCHKFKQIWTPYFEEYNDVWIYRRGIYPHLLYSIQFGIMNYLKRFAILMDFKRHVFDKFFRRNTFGKK